MPARAALFQFLPLLLLVVGCRAFFWTNPLRCYNATWTARGPACKGSYTGRTCARSQADLDAYIAGLELDLLGDTQQCVAGLRDQLPPCPQDNQQLSTPEVLNNLCCGRGSTCNSDADCERLESLSGFRPRPCTVLELTGGERDFIAVRSSNPALNISGTSFSLAFWARRRQVGRRMMVLWSHDTNGTQRSGRWANHTGLHIGFTENDTLVFSFNSSGWDAPSGLQTARSYPHDKDVWVHWVCTYDAITKNRIIYRNSMAVATDAGADGYAGRLALLISWGPLDDNPFWVNGTSFHGTLGEIYVLTRPLSQIEISLLMRDIELARNDSLVLYFDFKNAFEQGSVPTGWTAGESVPWPVPLGWVVHTDPSTLLRHYTHEATGIQMTDTPPGPLVEDRSGHQNHGQVHANINPLKPHLYEDSVPVHITCMSSGHGPSGDACRTSLSAWQYGFCGDSDGSDIVLGEAKLADLALPTGYVYPPSAHDAALKNLQAQCTTLCNSDSEQAGGGALTGCELKLDASTASCFAHALDTAQPSGTVAAGGMQYCWSARSIVKMAEYSLVELPTSCEAANAFSLTSLEECQDAAKHLSLPFASSEELTDVSSRKMGCHYHSGDGGNLLFNEGSQAGEGTLHLPCNAQGYAGCLCATRASGHSSLNLPPANVSTHAGPGGWTQGLTQLVPTCFPPYFDDRSYQCLFRSICGAAYDELPDDQKIGARVNSPEPTRDWSGTEL